MSHLKETEHSAAMSDGTELFYRAWQPDQPTSGGVVLFHRGHEHSGRLRDVVEALDLERISAFAWDARGHGRSPGTRGYAPSFSRMVRDVDDFMRHICQAHGQSIEDLVVLAHSVGAVSVTTWVHDYAPRIRALVLVTPALRVKLYVPFAIPALRLILKLKGKESSFVKSYVKSKMLTHDPEQARKYDQDTLINRGIAVNILLGMRDAAERVIADAAAIRVPTLLLAGGSDWVVTLDAQRDLFERLGSPRKRMRVFDNMYHDVLHEKDRRQVLDEVRAFVTEELERHDPPPPLLDADKSGYTRDEYDGLRAPLPMFSPGDLSFSLQSLLMRTLGRLSRGVRLGYESGFDSGQTLDYVYENRARGALLVGKLFDRAYLDSIGWRGIRIRKVHIERQLRKAIALAGSSGGPVRVLDIATGCGRYVLEALRGIETPPVSALVRDYREDNLAVGRKLARDLGLENIRFQLGDAFDEASLCAVDPRPDVAIVSGLYELFPENDVVMRSLRGLAAAVKPGGYLVYTGQPWHPQIEMIARVLPNREGQPWIMRRRTQEEMDDLVRHFGFRKLDMEIDDYGIFTVSLARREA
jgi:alpha-beta hydrolase superfamily lysophospholipase/SAM-dependent methyltransferase